MFVNDTPNIIQLRDNAETSTNPKDKIAHTLVQCAFKAWVYVPTCFKAAHKS